MSVKVKVQELDSSTQELLCGLFTGWKYSSFGDVGCIMPESFQRDADNYKNMAVRPDDVWVVTFPRSGTTWTQELVWLLKNDLDYDAASKKILRERYTYLENIHIHQLHLPELSHTFHSYDLVVAAPSPRFLKTHLPVSLLPRHLLRSKVVYVARDPRDAAVSYYHLSRLYFNYIGDFKTYWNLFMKGLVIYSPFFSHLKQAWALRHHENMLFIFYEDMIKDLGSCIKRVADFLGKTLTSEEIAKLCDHLDFKNFKNNTSVNGSNVFNSVDDAKGETLIRKGKAGAWREYFDAEMSAQAQEWIRNNLADSDLSFPSHLTGATLN